MKLNRITIQFLSAFFIFANAQTPVFSPARFHYKVTGMPWSVAVADFNHDGSQDIASASRAERRVTVRLGNGDGTLQDVQNYAVGISPRSLVSADFKQRYLRAPGKWRRKFPGFRKLCSGGATVVHYCRRF